MTEAERGLRSDPTVLSECLWGMFKRHRQRGFTLVEILIVVVIIGILAIIIVPKFSQFTDQTRATTTVALLRTIRNQIDLYQAQH